MIVFYYIITIQRTLFTRLGLELINLRDRKFKQLRGHTKVFFEVLKTELERRDTIYSIALHIEIKGLTS